MKIRFWGVRGSIASPGLNTMRYGGNTPCIEIRGDNNELLILDAGSGLRELGNFLLSYDLPQGDISINMFLSHTHWDHIQGFPFFVPLYIPSTKMTIYGPGYILGKTLYDIFHGQMMSCYFPVHMKQLQASLKFVALDQQEFKVGDFSIKTLYLNHPLPSLSYRIEYKGKIFVSVFDHEYYFNPYTTPECNISSENLSLVNKEMIQKIDEHINLSNQRILDFISDADLLVHDAQYLKQEYYAGKIGWGHSYIEQVISLMIKARARRLALFHHDPMRTDSELNKLHTQYLQKINATFAKRFFVFFARERLQVNL